MFFKRYSRAVYRFRWLILLIWLLGTAASFLFLPDLKTVVASRGTSYLPSTAPSLVASQWLNRVDPTGQTPSSAIVAIHNPSGITSQDTAYFNTVLRQLNRNKSRYHIATITASFNTDKRLASSFTSKDGTTAIAVVGLPSPSGEPANVPTFSALKTAFSGPPSDAHVYFTGDAEIQQDNLSISQQGVDKSAAVTVVLVLVILLLVFRSVVSPVVTLLSIGMSFLITSGIVAWLAERGLPISTFTQTFLIAILFGAGTDYSIIMMNRFREELMHGHPTREEALHATLRAVSKTVLFSGLTVFVSFAILYFAKFGLYQSAVGVSIGMLVTLLTCLLFIPALLATLGGTLFWPRKPKVGTSHPPFKFWAWTGTSSIRRPWITLAALLIVLTPIGLLFTNNRTFDPMTDIPQAPSVEGFHVLAKSFGQGKVMPVTLVLNTSSNLRTPEGLATIQNLTNSLAAMPNVSEVDSATEPTGKTITAFQLANQDLQVSKNLAKIQSGLNQLNDGVMQANQSSTNSQTGVKRLQSGSERVTQGLTQLHLGLSAVTANTHKVATGTSALAKGATALQGGIQKLSSGLKSANTGVKGLAHGLSQLQQGTSRLTAGTSQLSQSQTKLESAAQSLANALAEWAKTHPGDAATPTWQQIMALAEGISQGEAKAQAGSQRVASGINQVNNSALKLTAGAAALQQATGQLASGGQQLATQAPSLTKGTKSLASGIRSLSTGVDKLSRGAGALTDGSQRVTQGIGQLGNGMQRLHRGFGTTSSAITNINQGVSQVNQYLKQSGTASRSQNPGFYVPKAEFTSNKDLQNAMRAYVSPDGHVAKFAVVLTEDPYSSQALGEVSTLEHAAKTALAASPIQTGQILAAGATATQSDLNSVSSSDFVRTMVIVLCAICLLLMVMLRSVFTPLYIIASLAGTYFVTMGLLQEIVLHVMHEPGISWVAPFFVFLLLVALGVDYSIFLMSRYEEEMPTASSLAKAMRDSMIRMGGVIFSAALIMGGTFGSLAASGVTSLVELAVGIVLGLFIYATVFLAFFVPAAAAVVGDGHVWPFGWRAAIKRGEIRSGGRLELQE